MAQVRRAKSKKANKRQKARILIVEARFYDDIADALLKGATDVIEKAGATYDRLTVPGSLEIPAAIAFAIEAAERKGKPYDGAVALGCVIRGDTIHFEIVSEQSARALIDYSVTMLFPIGNGILTVDTEQQAWQRARMDELDKGGGAAEACLAMVKLKRQAEAR